MDSFYPPKTIIAMESNTILNGGYIFKRLVLPLSTVNFRGSIVFVVAKAFFYTLVPRKNQYLYTQC